MFFFLLTINKNMSYEYGMVNGKSCSYVKLGKYNDCSRAEIRSTQVPVGNYNNANVIPSFEQVVAANDAAQPAPVSPAIVSLEGTMAPLVTSEPTLVGVNEGFAEPNYVPSYNVPNYPPINTVSLTHGVQNSCGGYFNIMDAYGGMGSGSCVTNYINN